MSIAEKVPVGPRITFASGQYRVVASYIKILVTTTRCYSEEGDGHVF
jgi:hypothetical protein